MSDQINFNDRSKPSFLRVDEHGDGQRLDNYLFSALKGLPKSRVYKMIRTGELRINKGRAKQTTRLRKGDLLRLPPLHSLTQSSSIPVAHGNIEQLNDTVIFEDQALLAINKPSGLAVHGGSGIAAGIIENLRAARSDLGYLELVHRLAMTSDQFQCYYAEAAEV